MQQSQFEKYTAVLSRYADYWQLTPFAWQKLPWDDPGLAKILQQLSLSDAEALDTNAEQQRRLFEPYFPELFALPGVATLTGSAEQRFPFWLTNGIAGRKLEQINAFLRAVPQNTSPLLEWCAGKGHLGRLLSVQQQRPVTSVEWQPALCRQGETLAQQHSVDQRFVQADVLSPDGTRLLHAGQQVVALHACGELHIELLRQAVARGCSSIQLAPCCYHLIDTANYQPLSAAGQAAGLTLSQHDLKLAVQKQVTAGARVARLRHTEVWWRLAFHALEVELTGDLAYRPLNSVGKHWFSGDFSDFACWAAEQHGLSLPGQVNWQLYLERGAQHQRLVAQIDAVRHLFRRAVEMWLVLDRALFLEQHGYQVEVQTFCAETTTPRNLMLSAARQPSH